MVRVAILADTHLTSFDGGLGDEVASYLQGVDLILHAGDVYAASALDWLETFAPVVVARGNGDETLDHDLRVKEVQLFHCAGIWIGARHWFDYPLRDDAAIKEQVYAVFGRTVDVVVFGDTHVPVVDQNGSILLVNPGSPTVPRMRLGVPGTIALLEVTDGSAQVSLVHLQQAIRLKLFGNREPRLNWAL